MTWSTLFRPRPRRCPPEPEDENSVSVPGDLVITSDVAGEFSRMVVSAFRNRPQETFSLALTGSHDARSCYERLATEAGAVIDWWKVDVYWADERCIPHDHDDSNYRMARRPCWIGSERLTPPT